MAGNAAVDAFLGADAAPPPSSGAVDDFLGASPPPAAPVAGVAQDQPRPADQRPFVARTRPVARVQEAFEAPLGPSDATLDALGLNPFGASGILRAPVRGGLILGDAAGRLIGSTINTAGDIAGDLTEGVTRLAPNVFGVDPRTAGNQAQRETGNFATFLGTQAGGMRPRGTAPQTPTNALTAPVAVEPPVLRRVAPTEAPMAAVAPEAAGVAAPVAPAAAANALTAPVARVEPPSIRLAPPAETPMGPVAEATPAAATPAAAAPAAAESAPAAAATSPSGITARLSDQPLPAQAIPEKLPRRPLLPILTESGAAKQADRIIQHFAEGGPTEANTAELLPGSRPTLAQATGNPGIATLERGFRDVNPNAFIAKSATNSEARLQAYAGLAGTEADMTAAEGARDAATAALRDKAFANPQPVDPLPVASKIKEILASPEGQRDVVKDALTRIYNKIVSVDPSNDTVVPQTDPAQLYGIRKAINDSLSPLARGTPSDARQASRELIAVKRALDDTIETGAPGFKDYVKAYEEHSRPIDGMRYLQSLNLTDARGNIMLGKLDAAVKGIEKQQKQSGVREASSVSPEQLGALKAIRDDMRREANSSLGKSLGSNTFQNFATNALTAKLGSPLVHMLLGAHAAANPFIGVPMAGVSYGLEKAAQRGERLVQNALQERLLNPEIGANALTKGK